MTDSRWPKEDERGTLAYLPDEWCSIFQLDDDWEICETNYHWSWNPLPDLFNMWSWLSRWSTGT